MFVHFQTNGAIMQPHHYNRGRGRGRANGVMVFLTTVSYNKILEISIERIYWEFMCYTCYPIFLETLGSKLKNYEICKVKSYIHFLPAYSWRETLQTTGYTCIYRYIISDFVIPCVQYISPILPIFPALWLWYTQSLPILIPCVTGGY